MSDFFLLLESEAAQVVEIATVTYSEDTSTVRYSDETFTVTFIDEAE